MEEIKKNIIVGCIDIGSELVPLYNESGNEFVYQTKDGTYENISIDAGEIIKSIEISESFYEDLLQHVQVKAEEQGLTVDGLIFASEAVYIISLDYEEAYPVNLQEFSIKDENKINIMRSDA